MDRHAYNVMRGFVNRFRGGQFEERINAACAEYRRRGVASIDKTPEPMKIIRSLGNGRFEACFKKKAQPDFKGTLKGGRSVVFETKYTEDDRIEDKALLKWQKDALEEHRRLGADCYVVASIGKYGVFSIPISRWNEVQKRKGRKYIKPEDVPECHVFVKNGVLDILNRFS